MLFLVKRKENTNFYFSFLDHEKNLMHYTAMKFKFFILAFLLGLSVSAQAGTPVKIPLLSYAFEPTFVELYAIPAQKNQETNKNNPTKIEMDNASDASGNNPLSISSNSLWLHLQGVEWSESTNILRFYLIPSADLPNKNQEEYYLLNIKRSKKSLDNPAHKDNFLIDISYMANKIKLNSDNKNLISGQRIIIGFKRMDLNSTVVTPKEVTIENARVFWVEEPTTEEIKK